VEAQPVGAASRIITDLSQWPVLLITAPPRISDEEMQRYIQESRANRMQRREPHVLVLDVRHTERLPPTQRKLLTDSMSQDGDADRCVAMAMVFDSPLLRGVLTAIFWVRKPKYPTRVFTSLPDALAWARATLDGVA
jgi:hypothetical protein